MSIRLSLHFLIGLALSNGLAVSQATATRRKLRVGMIPFTFPPWTFFDNTTGVYSGGLYEEFYRNVAYIGNFDVEFVPIADPDYMNDFTGVMTKLVGTGELDMGWVNPFGGELVQGFRYTPPMIRTSIVVFTKRTQLPLNMWQVFEPFDDDLWLTIGASVVFGALVMVTMTKIHSGQPSLDTMKSFPGFLYHTAAALLGGDEYDLYHCPPLGRLYRLGLLFLVMVSGATYTANLAAFLSKPTFKVHGPRTLEDLKLSTVCIRWPQHAAIYAQYVKKMVVPPAALVASNQQAAWSREKLQSGECDAILAVDAMAKLESLEYCEEMQLNPDISFSPGNVYTVMRDSDAELVHNVSDAMLTFIATPAYPALLQRTVGFGRSCSAQSESELAMPKITVFQMSSVFIVFAGCSAVAIVGTLAQRIWNRGKPLGVAKEEVQNEKLDTKLDSVMAEVKTMRRLDKVLTELADLKQVMLKQNDCVDLDYALTQFKESP